MELPIAPGAQQEEQAVEEAQPVAPAQPQGQAQQPQGQGQPAQGGQQEPFPADKAEALQFSNDILQILVDPQVHTNNIKGLSQIEEAHKVEGIALMASNLVGDRVTDVKAQTGRPIEMRLAIGAIRSVVDEFAETAEGEGFFSMSVPEKQQSIQRAAETLDNMTGAQNNEGS